MVRVRLPSRRPALLQSAALASVVLFTTTAVAQGNNNNNNNNNDDDDEPPADPEPAPSADDNEDAADSTPSAADEDDDADNEPTPTPADNDDDADESPSPTPSSADDDEDEEEEPEESPSPTPEPTPSDANNDDDESSTTTTPTTVSENSMTDFPSLTMGPVFKTYPAAAVPPTVNAPFMQHSTAPEGTVFIAVGAILGAFGLGILLWRGIVACLLHRSVRRANMEQHAINDKAAFPAPPAQFYKYGDHSSSLSIATAGTPAGRGQRRTTRGPIPSATPSQSNLFFSPTAGAGASAGANAGTASSRDSRFLPSGFYAAGNSSPGNANHTHNISLTNLRPDSRGLSRGGMREVTPPDSPHFTPRRDMSTSSVNLSAQTPLQQQQQGGRAPSAYLEDLLDENPEAFPVGQMPPPHPQHPRPPPGHGQR